MAKKQPNAPKAKALLKHQKRKEARKQQSKRKKQSNDSPIHSVIDTRTRWILLAILLLTAAIYAPTFQNEFVNWDDDLYVTDNYWVQNFSGESIKQFWTAEVAANYHPLTMMTLGMNYMISGMNPWSYQLVNILLHLLNVFLVFYAIFLLTDGKSEVALIVALIFGIHPMHVESVSWVAERKDVLYTVFFMGGMITYLQYLKNLDRKYYIWTIVLFLLSLLSKPAAVVFPVVLLLVDYYKDRELKINLLIEKAPLFILAIIFGLITTQIQSKSAVGDFAFFSIPERIMIGSYTFSAYIAKFFVPIKLSSFYPYPYPLGTLTTLIQVAPLAVLLVVGIAAYSLKRTKILIFGLGFYLVTIALVLQFLVTVGDTLLSERYTYVPYIGLAFMIAMGYDYLVQQGQKLQTVRYAALGILGVAMLYFAYASFTRTQVWKNSETLWADVISKYPDVPVANNNLGLLYRRQDPQKALQHYNKALEVNERYSIAYLNRGNLYFDMGKDNEAIADYSKVLEYNPNESKAYSAIGALHARGGRYDVALENLNKAIQIASTYADPYLNRALTYTSMQRYPEAIADYDQYLKLKPGHVGVYNNRGVLKQQVNRHQEAVQDFSLAIQVEPNNPVYYQNRARSYQALGNAAQANQDNSKAQQLQGGQP